MKKFVLAFLLMAVLLVGCSKDPIIGTWEGKSNDGIKTTFTFKSGDKMVFANEYGFEKEKHIRLMAIRLILNMIYGKKHINLK